MDKSYVTLEVCCICGHETGSLLLDRRLRPKFDMHTKTGNVCDECRKKYLSEGVLILAPETGALVVIKDEAFKRLFNIPMPKGKIAFCEPEVIEKVQKLYANA